MQSPLRAKRHQTKQRQAEEPPVPVPARILRRKEDVRTVQDGKKTDSGFFGSSVVEFSEGGVGVRLDWKPAKRDVRQAEAGDERRADKKAEGDLEGGGEADEVVTQAAADVSCVVREIRWTERYAQDSLR
jgi:hypothetical protein